MTQTASVYTEDKISRNQISIVAVAGLRSADAYYARTARLLRNVWNARMPNFLATTWRS